MRTGRSRLVRGAALATLPLVLVLAGCGASSSGSSASDGAAPGGRPATGKDTSAAGGSVSGPVAGGAPEAASGAGAVVAAAVDRQVVRTATLRLRVPDALKARTDAVAVATAAGGTVGGEQTVADPGDAGRTVSTLTLRVPADRLPRVLADLSGLGTLLDLTQDSSDVTGQSVDLAARINAQRASVARVQALLDRATRISDVVAVESELSRRQADLEAMEAQQRQLADQVALATVTATLEGPSATVASDRPTFTAGLAAGWRAFVSASSWLLAAAGAVLPFALLAAALALLARWALARRQRPGPVAPSPVDPPASASA